LRKLLIQIGEGAARGRNKGKTKGGGRAKPRMAADIELAMTEQGVDLGIKGLTVEGLPATEAMLDFAKEHRLARLTLDQGYGSETLWEPEPVTVSLGGVSIGFPPGAFLQATLDGEQALV